MSGDVDGHRTHAQRVGDQLAHGAEQKGATVAHNYVMENERPVGAGNDNSDDSLHDSNGKEQAGLSNAGHLSS